jgi:hypothetical protein
LAAAAPHRQPHLVEEALADLVHGDELLEAGRPDVDAGRAAETERRVTRHHVRIRIACPEPRRDVEGRRGTQVLLHAGQVRAYAQSRDQRARILTMRTLE